MHNVSCSGHGSIQVSTLNDNSKPDFIVNQPSASTSWANGSPYPFTWTKGLLDGIDNFDVELTRIGQDGLIYVAQNGTPSSPNPFALDVPPD